MLIGSTAKVPKDFIGFGITTHHDAKINQWKTDDQMMKDYLFWVMHTREFILHCIYHSVGTTGQLIQVTLKDLKSVYDIVDFKKD